MLNAAYSLEVGTPHQDGILRLLIKKIGQVSSLGGLITRALIPSSCLMTLTESMILDQDGNVPKRAIKSAPNKGKQKKGAAAGKSVEQGPDGTTTTVCCNGAIPNGHIPNGTLPNGVISQEHTEPNGTVPNGIIVNGTLPNGTKAANGAKPTLVNDTMPNGTLPNGVIVNAATMANGAISNGVLPSGGTSPSETSLVVPNGTIPNAQSNPLTKNPSNELDIDHHQSSLPASNTTTNTTTAAPAHCLASSQYMASGMDPLELVLLFFGFFFTSLSFYVVLELLY